MKTSTQQVYTVSDYSPKDITHTSVHTQETLTYPSSQAHALPTQSYHPSISESIHFGMYTNPYSAQDVYYHRQQPQPHPHHHEPVYANYSTMINALPAHHFMALESETNLDSASVHSELLETEEVSTESRKIKIPRPANCFFLFRRDKQSEIFSSNPGITNMEVSRIIGKMWKGISVEEKRKYQWMAEKIKLDHQQKYPDYKYSPNRTKSKRKQSPGSEFDSPSEGSPLKIQNCGGIMDHMNGSTLKSYFAPPVTHHNLMGPYFPFPSNKPATYYSNYETNNNDTNSHSSSLRKKGLGVGGLAANDFSNIIDGEYAPLPPVPMPDATGFDFKWLLEEDAWLPSSTYPGPTSTNRL